MLRPTAVKVVPLSDHRVAVTFDNGQEKVFDVKPYIKGSWYGALMDEAFFKSVRVNGFSIEWADGQDICPDELWENSVPLSAI